MKSNIDLKQTLTMSRQNILEGLFMLKQERQQKILELIQQHTYLSISDIASRLDVSEMTIRQT